MQEQLLFMLLRVTVLPVLEKITTKLEAKAKATENPTDDIILIPFRTVIEALKLPGFVESLKR